MNAPDDRRRMMEDSPVARIERRRRQRRRHAAKSGDPAGRLPTPDFAASRAGARAAQSGLRPHPRKAVRSMGGFGEA